MRYNGIEPIEKIKLPQVEYNIPFYEVWAMRLAKEGFGNYDEIRQLPVDLFFNLVNYSKFEQDYDKAVRALNKKG